MTRSWPLAAVIAVTALAGCVRNGPPAPVSLPGAEPKPAAPAAAQAPQQHRPHPDRVTVAKGETLYTISRRYDVPLRSIIDANRLDPPFQIKTGTVLNLPQERFHVVRQGDTLYAISRLYGVEMSTLVGLNRLSPPYALQTGEILYLPTSVEPPDKAVAAAGAAVPEAKPAVPTAGQPGPPGEKSGPPVTAAAAAVVPAPEPTKSLPRTGKGFDWPLAGRIVESYGTGANGAHNDGINIAAREGEAVRAADAGVVAYAGNELRGYGNLVLIKHSGGYMTAYAHNSQLLVKRGDLVKRGQEIAKAGATGTVDSPQLHFEIRQGTHALDPTTLLPSVHASAK